jgi:N6-L-threonylcarbamoyladenine synthase
VSGHDLVLGIESSCDELGAAVVRGGREILSNVVHSQIVLHRPYGGVVPELASRDHVRRVTQVVRAALEGAGAAPSDLAGVAVTAGPGLIGSLLVGLCFGKAFAYRHRLPCVGVHHLEAHLVSAELSDPALEPPYLGLVVSGGHTALYRLEPGLPPVSLGETRDDAVGEAFDKVAVLLGLPYPGGPHLALAAERGDPKALDLPRPLAGTAGLDFSYSGLKTAVAHEVARRASALEQGRIAKLGGLGARCPLAPEEVADVAASFQAAAVDHLVSRARRALAQEGLATLAVVGGVAANQTLRRELAAAGARDGFRAVFPPLALCSDNAAMIAAAGARRLSGGESDGLELAAFSRLPVGAWPARTGRAPHA